MFYNICVPLIFVALGVFANRLGRKDNDSAPMVNLFAVATSTALMSLATAISDLSGNMAASNSMIAAQAALPNVATQAPTTPNEHILLWIVIFLALLVISIDLDRYSSWVRDKHGMPTGEKHIFKGVIGPTAVVFLAFVAYRVLA